MPRPKHPNKEIEAALQHAESRGWRVEQSKGHAWGKMYCPYNNDECRCGEFCITSIWSTPRVPEDMASKIVRVVDKCTGNKKQVDAAKHDPAAD